LVGGILGRAQGQALGGQGGLGNNTSHLGAPTLVRLGPTWRPGTTKNSFSLAFTWKTLFGNWGPGTGRVEGDLGSSSQGIYWCRSSIGKPPIAKRRKFARGEDPMAPWTRGATKGHYQGHWGWTRGNLTEGEKTA